VDVGLTVRLFPLTVVPLMVSTVALLTVQFSVVLAPLPMVLFAAVKLEITGAVPDDVELDPPPHEEAIARSNAIVNRIPTE
jgi:hypothetical protein